jgi:hypothetical protein
MGFTYITLEDTASVIRNQWGDRIQNCKVLNLWRNCEIYMGQIRLVSKMRISEFLTRIPTSRTAANDTQVFSVFIERGRANALFLI